jgi:hypothetical protein
MGKFANIRNLNYKKYFAYIQAGNQILVLRGSNLTSFLQFIYDICFANSNFLTIFNNTKVL